MLSLKRATLLKRYKRFLADVVLEDGSKVTIHVANTGAMTGCADEGDIVWYSTSNNPKRKYPFSWEFTQKPNGDLICVNTHKANEFVNKEVLNGNIPELNNFDKVQREVKYGEEKSKIDFLLTEKTIKKTYVEVKSVTLLESSQGYFPDAKTIRGQKHLRELMSIVKNGENATLLFFVMHTGINSVTAARHVDPIYADLLNQAQEAGVKILAYKANFKAKADSIDLMGISPLKVIF